MTILAEMLHQGFKKMHRREVNSSGENMLGSVGIPRRLEDVIGAYHHKDIIPNKKLMPILFQNYKKNVNVGNSERQNQNEGKNSCAD